MLRRKSIRGYDVQNRFTQLELQNAKAVQRRDEFRRAVEAGEAQPNGFQKLKREFPFHGFVECEAAGLVFSMFSSNDDIVAWQFFWGGPDSYETAIIAKWVEWAREAKSVLDIGAYTGLMSIVAAMVNPHCEVHAMEPIPQTAERARINLRANNVERQVTIHNRAAANESGVEMINMYRGGDVLGAGNSIHDKGGKRIFSRQMIQTVNVDQHLGHKRFDLIKVDVEGFETQTLMGLRRIMKRDRPKLVLELWKENEAEVFRLLDTLEYRYEPVEREPVRVMNYFCEPMA